MNRKSIIFSIFALLVLLPSITYASSIAKVIAITSGVTIERDGNTQELAIKDDLFIGDIVRTNAEGKVQFIFNDNSVVNVGINSTFVMENYNDADNKAFRANLSVGFARLVTGAIVEQNPEAFSVRTPESNVGIRGTTVAIFTLDGVTTVLTENSLRQLSVVANNVVIPPGHEASFGADGQLVSPVAPIIMERRQYILEQTNIVLPSVGASGVNPLLAEYMENNTFVERTAQDSLQTSLANVDLAKHGLLLQTNGTASGTFNFSEFGAPTSTGNFSFLVNLQSGVISDANFTTTDIRGGEFTATGGTGRVLSGGAATFQISGGTATFGGAAAGAPVQSWGVTGTTPLQVGGNVGGDFEFLSQGGTTYSGNIQGTLGN